MTKTSLSVERTAAPAAKLVPLTQNDPMTDLNNAEQEMLEEANKELEQALSSGSLPSHVKVLSCRSEQAYAEIFSCGSELGQH